MPTGRPAAVIPAGRLIPGMPATLPGPLLRTKVMKVGAGLPLSGNVSSSPIKRRRRRRGREDDGRNAILAEVPAIRICKRRALLQRFAVDRLRHSAVADKAHEDAVTSGLAARAARPAKSSALPCSAR